MAAAALQALVFRIRFRNPAKSALTLWIEPIGDQVAIPGGTTVEVHCTDTSGIRMNLKRPTTALPSMVGSGAFSRWARTVNCNCFGPCPTRVSTRTREFAVFSAILCDLGGYSFSDIQ